jgi:hypothetical protein
MKKRRFAIWGASGGRARAKALSPAKRRELAQIAARARWQRTAKERLEKLRAKVERLRKQVERKRKS